MCKGLIFVLLDRFNLFVASCFDRALLLNGHKLPAARKAELTEIVQLYYGVDSLADDLLKEGIELDTK